LQQQVRPCIPSQRTNSPQIAFAKPGTYGYTPPPVSPPLTFAPNVTPISYSAPSPSPSPFGSPSLTTDQPLPLFPPSATPAPPPTRRRVPPGKRRSQGYIPRPPNAFMLFRADFVRQKHVPGSIETNHGSLSKIIGRSFPL
jgi:transcription factor SOX7/8/10/18 (SOX group E/F)